LAGGDPDRDLVLGQRAHEAALLLAVLEGGDLSSDHVAEEAAQRRRRVVREGQLARLDASVTLPDDAHLDPHTRPPHALARQPTGSVDVGSAVRGGELEPGRGIEPRTYSLRVNRSAD